MPDYAPICGVEDAQHCMEQAKSVLERARSLRVQARESLEDTQTMRASLYAQIEELANRGPFRAQFTTTLLLGILDAVIQGTSADMGNIQLYDPESRRLHIHVHRGFHEPFLEFFNSVHADYAACGAALKSRKRVIVTDIADSPIFYGSRLLEVMLDAGIRSVQSTPLLKFGRMWGMLSTHYRTLIRPTKKDLRLIDYFADWAADILEAEHRSARLHADTVASDGNRSQKLAGVLSSPED